MLAVVTAGLLTLSGGASARGRSSTSLPPGVARALSVVRCYAPDNWGYGFVRVGARPDDCPRLERVRRLQRNLWWLQIRDPHPLLPPKRVPRGGVVYCLTVHLGHWVGSGYLDVPGVGSLEELACPASAYPRRPEPDVRAPLRMYWNGRASGSVALSAVAGARTEIVVSVRSMDVAMVETGTCARTSPHRRLVTLNQFYSFRSDTIVPLSLASLTATPHVVFVDGGGAHGGDPMGCAFLARQR